MTTEYKVIFKHVDPNDQLQQQRISQWEHIDSEKAAYAAIDTYVKKLKKRFGEYWDDYHYEIIMEKHITHSETIAIK